MSRFSLPESQLLKEVQTVFEVQSAAITTHSKHVGEAYLQALALMKNCKSKRKH